MLKLVWLCAAVGLFVLIFSHKPSSTIRAPQPIVATPTVEPSDEPQPTQVERDDATAKLSEEFPPYENTVGKTAAKIGLAHVYLICGLRDGEWYQQTTLLLERQLQIDLADIPEGQGANALGYARRQAQISEKMSLGHRDRAGCPDFRAMPFTQSDDAVAP